MFSRTTKDVINSFKVKTTRLKTLAPPNYYYKSSGSKIGLSVPSMANHMSDEGWQLFLGLKHGGYDLCGSSGAVFPQSNFLKYSSVDLETILDSTNINTLVVQDCREWDSKHHSLASKDEHYKNVEILKYRDDIFKVGVVKDSHQNPKYFRDFFNSIGCHAWICYYHPNVVSHLASYVRREHLLRTYHTVDSCSIPEFQRDKREGTLLSGAVYSHVYPLRNYIQNNLKQFPSVSQLKHPGYHKNGTNTNSYLETLNQFKVAICTSL
jgi:hypothetical protein